MMKRRMSGYYRTYGPWKGTKAFGFLTSISRPALTSQGTRAKRAWLGRIAKQGSGQGLAPLPVIRTSTTPRMAVTTVIAVTVTTTLRATAPVTANMTKITLISKENHHRPVMASEAITAIAVLPRMHSLLGPSPQWGGGVRTIPRRRSHLKKKEQLH